MYHLSCNKNNATPCILIGSRHAYAIKGVEAVKQGSINDPVALKTKLGYTIYDGALEYHSNQPYAVQSIQKVFNKRKMKCNRRKLTRQKRVKSKENRIKKVLDINYENSAST